MKFEIAKVVQQIIDEVTAARLEGLPVGMPDYVRFEVNIYNPDEKMVFEIPLLGDRKPLNQMLFTDTDVVTYSYGGAKVLGVEFFRDKIDSLPREKIEATVKRISEFPEKTKEEKEELIKKYDIPPDVAYMAKKLAFCIWWQDLRKKYIFMAIHCIKLFMQEFSRRYSIPFEELQWHTVNEMLALALDGKRTDVKGRLGGFVDNVRIGETVES